MRMYHPDIETLAEAADETQFKTVWEPRGWRRAPTELVEVNEMLGTNVVDLSTVDPVQLRHVAAARGVDSTDLTHVELARRLSGDLDLIDVEAIDDESASAAVTVPHPTTTATTRTRATTPANTAADEPAATQEG